MDQQPDLTPLWLVVAGGAIIGAIRWIAKRLLMVSPSYAALQKLSAEQREFHDRITADVQRLHDALSALAGHQEADEVRLAVLEKAVEHLDQRQHEGG